MNEEDELRQSNFVHYKGLPPVDQEAPREKESRFLKYSSVEYMNHLPRREKSTNTNVFRVVKVRRNPIRNYEKSIENDEKFKTRCKICGIEFYGRNSLTLIMDHRRINHSAETKIISEYRKFGMTEEEINKLNEQIKIENEGRKINERSESESEGDFEDAEESIEDVDVS